MLSSTRRHWSARSRLDRLQAHTVTLVHGLLDRLAPLLDAADVPARRFVVSNALVWRLHGSRLASAGLGEPILLADGERHKQMHSVSRVYDALIRAKAERSSTVITFGGGVIGDMAGFAAATYLRGIALVHIPTTLLAQVDSAIGGKVGVNHPLGKNLIGAFHQPRLVMVDPVVLKTLPDREFRSGLAEVIKHGIVLDASYFEDLEASIPALLGRDLTTLERVVAGSCRLKARVVERDEHEAELRWVLNYGHTIGHALEAATGFCRWVHGEAVSLGTQRSSAGERLGISSRRQAQASCSRDRIPSGIQASRRRGRSAVARQDGPGTAGYP